VGGAVAPLVMEGIYAAAFFALAMRIRLIMRLCANISEARSMTLWLSCLKRLTLNTSTIAVPFDDVKNVTGFE